MCFSDNHANYKKYNISTKISNRTTTDSIQLVLIHVISKRRRYLPSERRHFQFPWKINRKSVFALAEAVGFHLVVSVFFRSASGMPELKKDNAFWVPTFRLRERPSRLLSVPFQSNIQPENSY